MPSANWASSPFDLLPEDWEAVRVESDAAAGRQYLVTRKLADLAALAREPDRLHLVVLVERPGADRFTDHLELRHFAEGTPEARHHQFHIVRWEGLAWAVHSIPLAMMWAAHSSAAATGMRVADGVPTVIRNGVMKRVARFPMDSPTVYTIENLHAATPHAGAWG